MKGGERMKKISTANAEHYTWGGQCDGWHLVKQSALSVIRERMPPGASEVNHFHHEARQFFYVLSGTAVLDVDGTPVELGPGEGVEIAPGVAHQMRNASQGDVEFLVVSQPHSHGDREVVTQEAR
jgi:mannose-6-phosphate isomerase-like protein (cupin superfamily)